MDGYYIWLVNHIDTGTHLARSHRKLLDELYFTEFIWTVPMDSNRARDGLELRDFYEAEGNDPMTSSAHLDGQCSVLEMMVALAIRMERELLHEDENGDRTPDWFWNMVASMGLIDLEDDCFDEYFVRDTLDILLCRKYKTDGKGGLFWVKNRPEKDLRRVEIWYQMQFWVRENFDISL